MGDSLSYLDNLLTEISSLASCMLAYTMASSGADPGEVKWVNFHPPFFGAPFFFFFFSYPSNIGIILDFSDIITKIDPPFQNPGSALAVALSRQ